MIDNSTGQINIYDVKDRTWYTPGPAGWDSTWPESLPGNGKVYLARAKANGNMTNGLADIDAI